MTGYMQAMVGRGAGRPELSQFSTANSPAAALIARRGSRGEPIGSNKKRAFK